MARARSSRLSAKDAVKKRLKRPSCLRSPTKERLAAKSPTRPSPPPKASPIVKLRLSKKLPVCVQTTYTLEILSHSGVSILDDLEPAVRAISNPCGNFVWGRGIVIKVFDARPGTVLADGAVRNRVDGLQIILIHHDDNHDGNVCRETIAMFGPTAWEPRDRVLEKKEVISVDQILSEIRGWKDTVKSCTVVRKDEQKHFVMASKGPAYPNGMGNDKRFPPPWNIEAWDKRVAERKAKESAYRQQYSKKHLKLKLDGQWDEEDDNVLVRDDTFVDLVDSSESYKASSPISSSASEQS